MSYATRFGGRRILIGLCGGIAAYKVCDVIRQLYREGAECVQVMMTESAQAFVTPLTLETLTMQPVLTSALQNITVSHAESRSEITGATPVHVALAQQFDALLILPATANTLAKLAYGLCDDIVSTTALTFTGKPIVIAPAMNGRMWSNPLLQENIRRLESLPNVTFVPPEWGPMACRETGEGKLAAQETLLAYLDRAQREPSLADQRVVVTAGGTAEPIDAVRFMTNRSSGKMGVALADEAWAMGAEEVTLIHTLTDLAPRPYKTLHVKTVEEMAAATHAAFSNATILAMAAAVSDFKASNFVPEKIKKQDTMTIALEKTRDILCELGQRKQPGQVLIGFAAESAPQPDILLDKLRRKQVDLLACNDISRGDIGFGATQNELHLLFADGREVYLDKADKHIIAQGLWQNTIDTMRMKPRTNLAARQKTAQN
jgi:phosphopantothenoylcysteine decarboxylase / phosphopantothenate---cysteine ligase